VSNLSEAGWADATRRVPLRMSKHVEFAWNSQPVTCESNATAPSVENHGMAQIPPEERDRQLLPHVELIDASIRFHTSRHSKSRRRGRLLRRGGPFFTRRRSFAILDDAVLRLPRRGKPTPGLEPGTSSLRESLRAASDGSKRLPEPILRSPVGRFSHLAPGCTRHELDTRIDRFIVTSRLAVGGARGWSRSLGE
jgi:hypothetical protein